MKQGKWKIKDKNQHGDYYIGTDEADYFAIVCFQLFEGKTQKTKERAELICNRINSHDALVKACEAAQHELENRYLAHRGSPIDKLVLKIITKAIAGAKEKL